MKAILRSAALAAVLAAAPVAGLWAQTSTASEAGSGAVAKPTYPAGQANDPALTGQRPTSTASVPTQNNPHAPGATGSTVVPGDSSSVAGDHRGTVQQKTGTGSASGGGG